MISKNIYKVSTSLIKRFSTPIYIGPIIFFRISFGLIMLWEIFEYSFYGNLKYKFVSPLYHFPYYGFSWIPQLIEGQIYILFILLGVLATFIIIGFLYRLSSILFFLFWSYFFLLDKAYYLNHFYFIALISFLLIFIPANKNLSVDARINPSIKTYYVPSWSLWILRFQIAIVYFYAGIAKINFDWLHGQPIRMWLYMHSKYVNPALKNFLLSDLTVYLFSYGGLLLDLFIVPLLLWKRTTFIAIIFGGLFHILNMKFFNIGIFPWVMIISNFLFLKPQLYKNVADKLFSSLSLKLPDHLNEIPIRRNRYLLVLLSLFFLIQITVPLRHFLYPGNVSWTEEGHMFSWHMMLRQKIGKARFWVKDKDKNRIYKLNTYKYLNKLQHDIMASDPEMIVQFAHFINEELMNEGIENIEIYVDSLVSLNSRKPQILVKADFNLLNQKLTFKPMMCIESLSEPLPSNIN
jgi:hypothetical protein